MFLSALIRFMLENKANHVKIKTGLMSSEKLPAGSRRYCFWKFLVFRKPPAGLIRIIFYDIIKAGESVPADHEQVEIENGQ